MRPKLDARTASRENYKKFCIAHPKTKISFEQYKNILYTYNRKLILYVMESGRMLKLPYGFGILVITKYKPQKYKIKDGVEKNNLPIDWAATKEQGKTVRSLNLHTDGNKYYFAWIYNNARIKNNFIWSFKIRREFARLLAKKLKEDTFNYKDRYREWIRK